MQEAYELIDPDVKLFVRVIEAGSIAAAARRLGISAPAASRRLASLEARLGVMLIHRTTRRLELTAQGEQFYSEVIDILAAADAVQTRLAGSRGVPAGPLRVTAPTSFARLHIAPALKLFLDQWPQVALTLDLSDAYVDLIAGRYDMAVRITAEIGPGLEAERLATSRRVLCAAPDYLAQRGAPQSVQALETHDLLAADGQLPWRLSVGRKELVVSGHSAVRTNSSETVRELAIAGAGIALRSLWEVSGDLAAGRLVRVLPRAEGSLQVGIYAVRPRSSFVAVAVEAFTSHLRRTLPPRAAAWEDSSAALA